MTSSKLYKFLLLGLFGLSAVSAAACSGTNNEEEVGSPEQKTLSREDNKTLFEKGQKEYCEKITKKCDDRESTQQESPGEPGEPSTKISFEEPFNATVLCKVKGIIDGYDKLLEEHCQSGGASEGVLMKKYKRLQLPKCETPDLEKAYDEAQTIPEGTFKSLKDAFCMELGFPSAEDKCKRKGFEEGFNEGAQEAFEADPACADKKDDFELPKSQYTDAKCSEGAEKDAYKEFLDKARDFGQEQAKEYCKAQDNSGTDAGNGGDTAVDCKEDGVKIGQQGGLKTGVEVCTVELKLNDSSEEVDYNSCMSDAHDKAEFETGVADGFVRSLLTTKEACEIATKEKEEQQQAKYNLSCEQKVQRTLGEDCTNKDVEVLAECFKVASFTCDYSPKACVEDKVSSGCRATLDLVPLEMKPQTQE